MPPTPPRERLTTVLNGQADETSTAALADALRSAAEYVASSLSDDQAGEVLEALDRDNMVLHREYNLAGKSGEDVIGMILHG